MPRDAPRVGRREPPVGIEANYEEIHGVGDKVVSGTCSAKGIEVVHDAGEVDVAQWVEPGQKGFSLMIEIRFNGEIGTEPPLD